MEGTGVKLVSEEQVLEELKKSAAARAALAAKLAAPLAIAGGGVHYVYILPFGKTWVVIPGGLDGVHPGDYVAWGPVGTEVTIVFKNPNPFNENNIVIKSGEWHESQVRADVDPGEYNYKVQSANGDLDGDDGCDPSIIIN